MDKKEPVNLSRLDAYRVVLGFFAVVSGTIILYRTVSEPTFGPLLLGACFVGFGLWRLGCFWVWLKKRYPKA